jgi:hypothetical protein
MSQVRGRLQPVLHPHVVARWRAPAVDLLTGLYRTDHPLVESVHRAGTDVLERGCLRSVWRLVEGAVHAVHSPSEFRYIG